MKIIKLLSKRIIIIIAAGLLLIAAVRKVETFSYNSKFSDYYPYLSVKYTDDERIITPYEAGMPIDENFYRFETGPETGREYNGYIYNGAVGGTIYGGTGDNTLQDAVIELREPMRYYERNGNEYVLAVEYPAGTRVRIYDQGFNGFGRSFPTYERGWRYAERLRREDEDFRRMDDFESFDEFYNADMYFTTTEDLARLVEQVYTEYRDYFRKPIDMYLYSHIDFDLENMTDEQIKKLILFNKDIAMYNLGQYRSPDLYDASYFDITNIILLTAGGALLIAHIGAGGYTSKRRGADISENSGTR